jgi:hypothetical protein
MLLNQSIDLLQQLRAAVGQVLDARDIWEQITPVMTDGVMNERAANRSIEQLQQQRDRLDHLRPVLAQASSSLLRGIIIQSRTVPSMVASVGDEVLPLDAEEDRDSQGLNDPQAFVGEV